MSGKYVKSPGGLYVPGEQYTYESAELFLSIVQTEYRSEEERTSRLDSKLGISVPVISAYFFLILQDNTTVKELWQSVPNSGYTLVALLLYLITALTAFLSLLLMLRALMTRHYKRVNIKQFYTAKEMSRTKEHFSAIIATSYLQAIKVNRKQNNSRSKEYQSGWVLDIISLFCFFLYTCLVL